MALGHDGYTSLEGRAGPVGATLDHMASMAKGAEGWAGFIDPDGPPVEFG